MSLDRSVGKSRFKFIDVFLEVNGPTQFSFDTRTTSRMNSAPKVNLRQLHRMLHNYSLVERKTDRETFQKKGVIALIISQFIV